MKIAKNAPIILIVSLAFLLLSPGCGVKPEEPTERQIETQERQTEDQTENQTEDQPEDRTEKSVEETTESETESPTEQNCYYETANGEIYEVLCQYRLMDYQVYPTFDALEQAADLIVTGKFIDDAVREETNWIDRWENTFQITQVLKGDKDLQEIQICQFYGVDDEKRLITAASRLTPMEKDSEWIYFLNPSSDVEGCYRVTGTDSGRFPYRELEFDKLKNRAYTNKELGVFEVDEFFFYDDETGEFWGSYKVYLDILEKYNIAF